MNVPHRTSRIRLVVLGFACGFVAVLVFHQGMLALLQAVGVTDSAPFPTEPTSPFGVPQVWSAAFWGGVWGMVFALVQLRFPRGAAYWVAALLFGALVLTLVAWLVVLPLKGRDPGPGGGAAALTGLLVNGAWGVGTALLLRGAERLQAGTEGAH